MTHSSKILLRNVERRLNQLKWKRKDLAQKLSMKPGQLSNYLNGVVTPTLPVLDRLAEALGVSTGSLLTDETKDGTSHTPRDCFIRVWEIFQFLSDPLADEVSFEKLLLALSKKNGKPHKTPPK